MKKFSNLRLQWNNNSLNRVFHAMNKVGGNIAETALLRHFGAYVLSGGPLKKRLKN